MGPQNDDQTRDRTSDRTGTGNGVFSSMAQPATSPRPDTPPAPVSFGLLFQAPDTQVRAPRTAPATRDGDDGREDHAATGSEIDRADGSGDDEQPSRLRRRGGRGRRSRAGEDQNDHSSDADGSAGGSPEQSDGRGSSANDEAATDQDSTADQSGDSGQDDAGDESDGSASRRRTRRRRRNASGSEQDDPPGTVTKVREARKDRDEVHSIKGSTRLEAKKQRRREGREAGRRRTVITEAEFLARRESVERVMVVRERDGRTQIGVLEDGVLAEHYVSRDTQQASMAGNVYLGRVQNVLPSMEAAFVDIGRGRNAVLYAGEVNWDAAGLDNQPKRIEHALKSGESVLVQVTKDPIGHKGARLTSQISLPGRFLVYVPGNAMTGISRKLPDTERARLKKILKEIVPSDAGVIVRTAAEGASEEDLRADVERLQAIWERIQAKSTTGNAPVLLHGEPDLTVRVIRDVFNEDFTKLVVSGQSAWSQISDYLGSVAPELAQRLEKWTGEKDVFAEHRIHEQLAKAMDRKVWLPSGGSLVIDRTEAMTVIDVNTGKFIGSGGNLEETVTKNNLEAAEEIVRQMRLRDIGGIIVVDFIDMVLESNRDLVVRRLLECLGRDRTKHQVAEVTSLGLVQMTRKRVGSGLVEIFSEPCAACGGRGIIIHDHPVDKAGSGGNGGGNGGGNHNNSGNGSGRSRKGNKGRNSDSEQPKEQADQPQSSGPTAAQIAAAAHAAASHVSAKGKPASEDTVDQTPSQDAESMSTSDAPTETPDAPAETSEVGQAQRQDEQAAPLVAAARPRRKRKRVVAPAGPPTAATDGNDQGDDLSQSPSAE